ncbi:MAG: 16S rRNA (cytidine(1402)-2'-O)-methyltransferase [Marinosulfonomonas sp.]|nr:16S rRNA (cytidine(1402)-2'-O)-methyltransferase [Marinosulfonomonas sp.]
MIAQVKQLPPGLYFVATPIGTARDITLRCLDVLASADVIAAEDTRTARKLMDIHAIPLGNRKLIAYHDHNGAAARPKLLRFLAEGKSVAYASEAGTPLVADPGFALAGAAMEAGFLVTSAPGPSAVIAALTIGGLPTDRFLFVGFPPNTQAARRKFLEEFAEVPATLAFYESPKRIHKMLADMAHVLGADRQVAICRELTKRFEEVLRGSIEELITQLDGRTLKGEIVVLVDRNRAKMEQGDMEQALRDALNSMTVRDAANAVSEAFNISRRRAYQAALNIVKDQ